MLSEINKHSRDELIEFHEVYGDELHIYIIKDPKNPSETLPRPVSVTTIIHSYFPHFDAKKVISGMMKSKNWPNSQYYGMEAHEIEAQWDNNGKISSGAGTLMHANIEDFLNGKKIVCDDTEYGYFETFWNDFQLKYPTLKPYRTEWLVFDEDILLSGSIDFILEDTVTGELAILDWKRSKEIKGRDREKGYKFFSALENCNYIHYSLQLNLYRHILETKYNKKISFMMLVVLHPINKDYHCVPVNNVDVSSFWPRLTKELPSKH